MGWILATPLNTVEKGEIPSAGARILIYYLSRMRNALPLLAVLLSTTLIPAQIMTIQ